MMRIIDTIICWIKWLAGTMIGGIVQALNFVIQVLADAANAAISLLPDAAIERPELDQGILGAANFFLPMTPLALEAGVLVFAWGLYRIYRYLFRWFL